MPVKRLLAQVGLSLGGGQVLARKADCGHGVGGCGHGFGQVGTGKRQGVFCRHRVKPKKDITRGHRAAVAQAFGDPDHGAALTKPQIKGPRCLDLAIGGDAGRDVRAIKRQDIGRDNAFLGAAAAFARRKALPHGIADHDGRHPQKGQRHHQQQQTRQASLQEPHVCPLFENLNLAYRGPSASQESMGLTQM